MASDPRLHITFRLGEKGADWLDGIAQGHGVNRSVVLRACLVVARRHLSEVLTVLKEQV